MGLAQYCALDDAIKTASEHKDYLFRLHKEAEHKAEQARAVWYEAFIAHETLVNLRQQCDDTIAEERYAELNAR